MKKNLPKNHLIKIAKLRSFADFLLKALNYVADMQLGDIRKQNSFPGCPSHKACFKVGSASLVRLPIHDTMYPDRSGTTNRPLVGSADHDDLAMHQSVIVDMGWSRML
ncbi:hypothetical protein [Azospirillum picis]|nr:hypothetical protein [Azospirillum picis]